MTTLDCKLCIHHIAEDSMKYVRNTFITRVDVPPSKNQSNPRKRRQRRNSICEQYHLQNIDMYKLQLYTIPSTKHRHVQTPAVSNTIYKTQTCTNSRCEQYHLQNTDMYKL